uniref:Phosphoribulokinase/uridine kinase domain-containing protein n=1 Tax=Panagrolaimus sp. JU765 TaxID=591449 RepID=A0AC34RKE0_9BILA
MTKAIIFGIAGCTNSGKTTISKNIVEILKKKNLKVLHICQDDFYKTKEEVKQISHENDENEWFYHYDEPDSVNLQQMLEKIEQEAEKNDFLVVEGNMICEFEQVLNLLDHILFFTMEENECRRRREQRNYDPPDKPGYF